VEVVAVAEEHFFERARQGVSAERDGRMRKVRQQGPEKKNPFDELHNYTYCHTSFPKPWPARIAKVDWARTIETWNRCVDLGRIDAV